MRDASPEPKGLTDKRTRVQRPSVDLERAAPYDASNIAVFSRANDDRWHHFAITTVGSNALFIDGKLRANFKAELLFKAEEIRIGANFIGLLDEICIFNPGLQAPEIQALAGKPDTSSPAPEERCAAVVSPMRADFQLSSSSAGTHPVVL